MKKLVLLLVFILLFGVIITFSREGAETKTDGGSYNYSYPHEEIQGIEILGNSGETRYFTGTGGFSTTQSSDSQESMVRASGLGTGGQEVRWGIRVWEKDGDEITEGTPVAQVSRSSASEGIQMGEWVPPKTNMGEEIQVIVYAEIDGVVSWEEQASFESSDLGSEWVLEDETWEVYYYTEYDTRTTGAPSGRFTEGKFHWGDSSVNSRIEDFFYSFANESSRTNMMAVYDPNIGAPICNANTSMCVANSSLLMSRNNIDNTPEPNFPNTIDDCEDGTSGIYMDDESVENITITNTEDNYFTEGDTVNVSAWVYCWGTATHLGVVYTSDLSEPSWENKQALSCPGTGFREINFDSFELSNSTGYHAVRVYAYFETGSVTPQTCAPGSYADNDDVAFYVNQKTSLGIKTISAKNVSRNSAILLAELTKLEGSTEANVSFQYRIEGETEWQNTTEQILTETQKFEEQITNLQFNTTYEFKATAKTEEETAEGKTQKFYTADWSTIKPYQLENNSWTTNYHQIQDLEEVNDALRLSKRKVLDLDGTNDYVEMDGPIIPTNNDFVFEADVKVASGETAPALLLAQRDEVDGDRDFSLYTVSTFGDANNEVAVWIRGAAVPSNFLIGNDIRGQGWVTIKLEREGNTWRLYQDETLLDTATRDNDVAQVHTALFARARAWDRQTEGRIKNVRITVDGSEEGYWPINEGEGSTIYDEIGSNNGSLEGDPQWVTDEEAKNEEGARVSEPYQTEITSVGENRVFWQSTEPTGTNITIYTAITDTETPPTEEEWDLATNNESILSITRGQDLTGKYLWFKQTLKGDGQETPELHEVTTYINGEPLEVTDITMFSDSYSPGSEVSFNVTVVGSMSSMNVTIWHPTMGAQGDEDWDSYVLGNGTWISSTEIEPGTLIYTWAFNISKHVHYTNASTGKYYVNATASNGGEPAYKRISGFDVSTRIGIVLDVLALTVEGEPGTDNVAFNENPQLITHDGNVDQDILINGNDFTGPETIGVENAKYLNLENPASANTLTYDQAIFSEISPMTRGTYPSPTVEEIYYWLDIPTATKAGEYTGTVTITVE